MAWIEAHEGLADHPKTRKLAKTLDISEVCAVGHLMYLWWWAIKYAQDGDLTRYPVEDIAFAARWPGDAASFVDALVNCGFDGPGFLERTDDGNLLLHDWWDYAGRLIEKRIEDAQRKRSQRRAFDDEPSGGRPKDVRRTSSGHPPDGAETAQVPNPTQPNTTQPNQKTLAAKTPPPAPPPPRATDPPPKPPPVNGSKAEPAKTAKDDIRAQLEAHFCDRTGLDPPKTGTEKQRRAAGALWFAPLREMAEACGWNLSYAMSVMDDALDHLLGDGLTVAAPNSILSNFKAALAARKRGELDWTAPPLAPGGRSATNKRPAGLSGVEAWMKQEGISG